MKDNFANDSKYLSLMDLLLPPLLNKVESLGDDDNELFPLLDCFRAISIAIGPAFAPFSTILYKRYF
jgi:transportin-1